MAFIKLRRTNKTNCLINCDQIMAVTTDAVGVTKVLLPDAVIEVTESATYIENLIQQNYQVASSLEAQ